MASRFFNLYRTIYHRLGWLIEPYIKTVPRESLEEILTDTRKGVLHPPMSCPQECGAAPTAYLR